MSSFEQISGFYDLDYPEDSDRAFLSKLVTAAAPRHVLEIPCGCGRNVAVLLAATSGRVTFMDIAEPMVNGASRRIPDSERDRAGAVVGDMRSLGVSREFDLVVCPREAFQLLDRSDAARALRSMAASITGDGLIVIDLFRFASTPAPASDAPPDYFSPGEPGWVEDWTRSTADGSLTVTRRRRQEVTAGGIHFDMSYTLRAHSERRPRVIDLAFDMTNYSRGGFCRLAAQSGLDVLAAFAGYSGAPAMTSRSLRTVFVLGHERYQKGAERLKRISGQIAAARRASQADEPDAC